MVKLQESFNVNERERTRRILVKRDGGFICFYCKDPLSLRDYLEDHLNDDRSDPRIENRILSCRSCNNKKPFSEEMRKMALQKLRENELASLKDARADDPNIPTEIEINVKNFDIVEQYLTESVATDGFIEYSDALNSCTYICRKKTGHGSQQVIRYYIDALTSPEGPFATVRDENRKKIIVRRQR